MDENTIFQEFADAAGNCVLHARATRRLTHKELEALESQTERFNKMKEKHPDLFSAFENAFYFCLKEGVAKSYFKTIDSLDDRKFKVWIYRNNQYQWLLVEAYEAYEEFLRKLYARVGMINPSNWPLTDFRNTRLSELAGKSFSWYLELSRNKRKDFPDSVLKEMRKIMPTLKGFEVQNSCQMNMRVVMKTIEKFRHTIVHQNGCFTDLNTLVSKVNKECGIPSGTEESRKTEAFIKSFSGTIDEQPQIILLEKSVFSGLRKSGMHHSPLEELIKYIVSYAALLVEEAQALTNEQKV